MEEKDPKEQNLTETESNVPKKKKQQLVVSDNCKNCSTPLNLDQRFCANCGAKRIYNKLTVRNLIEDFTERFLNVENVFLQTFIHLWIRPEEVINGYINGLRKKYMSAFSYFAVALTLGSAYIFIFRLWYMGDPGDAEALLPFGFNYESGSGPSSEFEETMGETVLDLINKVLDYNSFLSFVYVPLYVVISKLVFWNYKQVNFIEHTVIYLYAYSQAQIVTSVMMIAFGWSATGQIAVSTVVSILPFVYTAYVLFRVFDLDVKSLILKTLLFLVIAFPIGLLFIALLGGGMYALGFFDPFIEVIKEQKEAQDAARAIKDSIATQDSIRLSIQKVKDTINMVKVIKDSL